MKINEGFLARMRAATQLLQSKGPVAATAAIQRALNGDPEPDAMPATDMRDINPIPHKTGAPKALPTDSALPLRDRLRKGWRDAVVETANDGSLREQGQGRFLDGSFSNGAGTRAYKLYVPHGHDGKSLPLVVMLHGCTQNPDDFAAGTGMNRLADERGFLVLYPAQAQSANSSHCWNWFQPGDQARDAGEPSIIAGMTREVMRTWSVAEGRVYVAGLSAGGAMAAIMGATYPDLYSAVGVHSGLPYGAAHDMPSAFAAMKRRRGKAVRGIQRKAGAAPGQSLPVIVFHGDRDATVHPLNGDEALAQFLPVRAAEGAMQARVEKGATAGGRSFTRTMHVDEGDRIVAEHWLVHGAPHAWSGGDGAGSYTDPKGPDASRAMWEFFDASRRTAQSA